MPKMQSLTSMKRKSTAPPSMSPLSSHVANCLLLLPLPVVAQTSIPEFPSLDLLAGEAEAVVVAEVVVDLPCRPDLDLDRGQMSTGHALRDLLLHGATDSLAAVRTAADHAVHTRPGLDRRHLQEEGQVAAAVEAGALTV